MKKIVGIFLFLLMTASISAQDSKPAEKPATKPSNNNTRSPQNSSRQAALERQKEARLALQRQQSYQRLMNLGGDPSPIPQRIRVYRDIISQYYRKPNKRELLAVKPAQVDLRKYASFLRGKNTGIVKLVPDAGCAPSTKVLVVSEQCRKYSMPGGGASFSFRTENYRIPRLSDVTFTGDVLLAKGALLEAVFVSLGNKPLQQISLQTEGVRFLHKMTPSKTVEEAFVFARNLADGEERDGFLYGRGVMARENTTFVLRSIAFRGKWMNAAAGVTYNEFDFDKRRDVIVAFRIVRKTDDGSITLLWKQLSNQRSPKLKIEGDKKKNN